MKARILNISWPWALRRHLPESCHSCCHLPLPPPLSGAAHSLIGRVSSFPDLEGEFQVPAAFILIFSLGGCYRGGSCGTGTEPYCLPPGSASRGLYSFPVAAVTNYHKLSGLEQQKSILSQCSKPEVQNPFHWVKIKVLAGLHSQQRLLGESSTRPASGGCQLSLVCGCITPSACFHTVFSVYVQAPLLCQVACDCI